MIENKLTTKNSVGEMLVGIEILPVENPATPLPVVILCHGFAYYKEEDGLFTEVAKRLAKKGYAVYYFDFSGCGESGGDYSATSLTKLVKDLHSIDEFLRHKEYLDFERLSLIGQSFGTSIAIASQLSHLERIVLCGSFADPYQLFKENFHEIDEHGISKRHHSDGTTTVMGPQFWADLKTYNLAKLISTYECPILFVHGKLDTTVPVSYMEPLFKGAHQPVGPVILPHSDHGLEPERELVFQAIEDFFPEV